MACLALLILYPVAWSAPLLRAGLLPFFGLSEISILSGLRALWATDPALTLLVGVLAIGLPYLKLAAMILRELGSLPDRLEAPLFHAGRLAMADVFLLALYIVLVKGVGLGRIETAWGLGLFSFCVLASLALSWRGKTPG
ncbi:paraquat-inducible protein A [Thioclava sp. BHET1]|nr:paraquat-inducible protein A [Thioclava sp. BHET1]